MLLTTILYKQQLQKRGETEIRNKLTRSFATPSLADNDQRVVLHDLVN
jgi:hypothetical protein